MPRSQIMVSQNPHAILTTFFRPTELRARRPYRLLLQGKDESDDRSVGDKDGVAQRPASPRSTVSESEWGSSLMTRV